MQKIYFFIKLYFLLLLRDALYLWEILAFFSIKQPFSPLDVQNVGALSC